MGSLRSVFRVSEETLSRTFVIILFTKIRMPPKAPKEGKGGKGGESKPKDGGKKGGGKGGKEGGKKGK